MEQLENIDGTDDSTFDDAAKVTARRSGMKFSRRRALMLLGGVSAAAGGAVVVDRLESARDPSPRRVSRALVTNAGEPDPSTRPSFPLLPNPVVSMWMNSWTAPTIAELPSDVIDTVNLLVFAMAQSAQGGTGLLQWEPDRQSDVDAAADIGGLVSRSKPVLLGIGGADDGGITLTSEEHVQQFCESVRMLVSAYGFTGLDLDLEPSGSAWEESAVVSALGALKREFGRTFLVGLTVGMYGEETARWLSLARALGSDYDYWAPMLYDFPEAGDDRLVAIGLEKVQIAVSGGVPAAKQVLGFKCGAADDGSRVSVTSDVWQSVVAVYDDLRGAFIWESELELESDYEWTREVGALVARS